MKGWQIIAAPACYIGAVSLAEANTSDLAADSHLSYLSFVNNLREHVVASLLPGLQSSAEVQAH